MELLALILRSKSNRPVSDSPPCQCILARIWLVCIRKGTACLRWSAGSPYNNEPSDPFARNVLYPQSTNRNLVMQPASCFHFNFAAAFLSGWQ